MLPETERSLALQTHKKLTKAECVQEDQALNILRQIEYPYHLHFLMSEYI